MRIGIIGARGIPARYGGFDTFATELAPRLVARGCDVTVYCQARYSLPERPRFYEGVRLVYLPAVSKRSLENVSHEAVSAVHALGSRYDVTYVLGLRATVLHSVARLLGQKVFFNTDGHDWQRRKWSPTARRYLEWSERFGVWLRPAGLIADSRAIGDYFTERYGVKAEFIPYGAPVVPPASELPSPSHELAPGGYFLVVCRLEPENNVDKVIDAYSKLDTDKKLVIVGGTNYESGYIDGLKAAAGSNVVFTGWMFDPDALNALMRNCYAYIHGHEVGGTNPSLLHAMAAGCCVLANGVIYNRQVLESTGLFWDSVESLWQAMTDVLADPSMPAALGSAAEVRVKEHYDWDRIADEYVELFSRSR